MTAVDWHDCELDHRLRVYMIDPNDHGSVLGELETSLSGCAVTWGYDTDTKVSAKLHVPDWGAYVPNAWIRLVHEIEGTAYRRDLFTGFVWDEGAEYSAGGFGANPSLMGTLKALQLDRLTAPVAIGQGAKSKDVAALILDGSGQPYSIAGKAGNHRYADASVLDAGDDLLKCISSLCDDSGWELRVDGSGTVRISPYVHPADKAPRFDLDADAGDTLVLSSGLSRTTTSHQAASRSIAVYKKDDTVTTGYADVGRKSPLHPNRRGYTVAEVHEMRDMEEPVTRRQLQDLAKGFLEDDSEVSVEWSVKTMWLPLEEGDAVMWTPPGQKPRAAWCKTVDADLGTWTLNLTLKEA